MMEEKLRMRSSWVGEIQLGKEKHVNQAAIYKAWASYYDYIYSWLLHPCHKIIAQYVGRAGSAILEVGVGTGLMLPHYPASCRITGIDISPEMINRASIRARKIGVSADLKVLGADEIDFPDGCFDCVTLPFVITLVPDYRRVLNECARVLRPGGRIVIASRMAFKDNLMEKALSMCDCLFRMIGWSSNFRLRSIEDWASQHDDVHVMLAQRLPPLGLFSLIVMEKSAKA